MPDFGFVGAAYEAPSIYQDGQECINYYPEIDSAKRGESEKAPAERGIIALYPTPGLLLRVQLPLVAEVRGLHVDHAEQLLYAVCGNTLYEINTNYVATNVGTLSSSTGKVVMTDNGVSLYLVDGDNRYYYTRSTLTFAQLPPTDGAFVGANHTDTIDTFIFYHDHHTDKVGATASLSVFSSALSFYTKDSFPDHIVAIAADHRELWVIGSRTTEIWINTGSVPFPFSRISGTSLQHGCAAMHSVARLGESLAWLSSDDRGNGVVIHMNGYQPMRISTHAIENDLEKYTTISDAFAYVYQQSGHEFYVLTFPSGDKTWVYDLATKLWHRRAWRDTQNKLHRHRGNCAAFFNGENVIGDWQDGKIFSLSQTTYTDNGAVLPRIRTATHLVADFKNVFYKDFQIQFQPGVGLQTGQGSDPQAILEWSDDGGSTYSLRQFASIGRVGQYKNRAIWRRLGYARDRVFRSIVTDPIYAPIISANLNANSGS